MSSRDTHTEKLESIPRTLACIHQSGMGSVPGESEVDQAWLLPSEDKGHRSDLPKKYSRRTGCTEGSWSLSTEHRGKTEEKYGTSRQEGWGDG